MKSFRDMAKSSAEKKMKMYGAKDNEVSSHIKNAEKYGAGGCIKKADGGSVGSDLDEMDGGMGKPRMDRGGAKKASTTVNIIVGKSGPDAGGMPPAPMAGPAPMPPGPAPMPPMRASGGRVGKADGGSISEDMKNEAGKLRDEASTHSKMKHVDALQGGLNAGLSLLTKGKMRAFNAGIGGLGLYNASERAAKEKEALKGAERLEKGMAEDGKEDRRAKGGRVNLTGGADSGIGRLEKNHKK